MYHYWEVEKSAFAVPCGSYTDGMTAFQCSGNIFKLPLMDSVLPVCNAWCKDLLNFKMALNGLPLLMKGILYEKGLNG